MAHGWTPACVIRRVGGLEEAHEEVTARDTVIRRVGGLEDRGRRSDAGVEVIRRVGGLEVIASLAFGSF